MSLIRLVEPVVRICAVITRHDEASRWAIDRLTDEWGPVMTSSTPIPFEAGGFYADSMGTDLLKTLVAFADFQDPGGLSGWKLATNDWETRYADLKVHQQSRPINMDAGYISQAKLVLATIKDRDHRIYLRDGIFAEVTLNYVGKQWVHHRWSYPSYRDAEVARFATQCRSRLRDHLQSTGQIRRVQSE